MKHAAIVAILASISAAAPQNNNKTIIVADECQRYAATYDWNQAICLDVGKKCFNQGKADDRDLLDCILLEREVPEAEYRCKTFFAQVEDQWGCRAKYMKCYQDNKLSVSQGMIDECAGKLMGYHT